MTPEEQKLSDEAIAFVKRRKKGLITSFADLTVYPPAEKPVSIFMAGSPGAGKTETSKRLIEMLGIEPDKQSIVRIDPDDIRTLLPGYSGSNSSIFQGAVSLGANKLHDHALEHGQHFVFDGTFSKIGQCRKNISRSIGKQRRVVIAYVFQDPMTAWRITKNRERVEGRNIPKEAFIAELYAAKSNVDLIKTEFPGTEIWLISHNAESEGVLTLETEIDSVDGLVEIGYSKEELASKLE